MKYYKNSQYLQIHPETVYDLTVLSEKGTPSQPYGLYCLIILFAIFGTTGHLFFIALVTFGFICHLLFFMELS